MKIRRVLITVSLLSALSACATVKEGFVGTEHENIVPFAEVSIEYLGYPAVDFRPSDLTYLRRYTLEETPELVRFRDLLARAETFNDAIVLYSLELVRIVETYPSESDRIMAYANALEYDFKNSFLNRVDVSPEEFAAKIDEIRGQDDFLGALRAAQPLVDMSSETFESVLFEIEDQALPALRKRIDADIEKEFATVLAQLDVVYGRRDDIMQGLQMIHAYQKGDQDALQGFGLAGIVLVDEFQLSARPSDAQLTRTKAHLLDELRSENEILDLLEQDVTDYTQTRAEFNREMEGIAAGLTTMRVQALAWTRGHQDLADGVKDPGKWMKTILDVAEGVKKVGDVRKVVI